MAKHGTLALRHALLLRRKDARCPMCEEQATLVESPHSPRPTPSGLHLTLVERARSRHGSRRGCAGAAAVGGHAEPTAVLVHPRNSGGGSAGRCRSPGCGRHVDGQPPPRKVGPGQRDVMAQPHVSCPTQEATGRSVPPPIQRTVLPKVRLWLYSNSTRPAERKATRNTGRSDLPIAERLR